jgi:hypothetical protein
VADLGFTTVGDLLTQYRSILTELRKRGIIRTSNAPLGDLAEKCASYVYGGELAPNSNTTFDLMSSDGRQIQVKCRQRSQKNPLSRRFSGMRSLEFEGCLFLLVDGDEVVRASEWSPADIKEIGVWQKTHQAWSVTTGNLLNNPQTGTDRTDDFQHAWWRLLNSTASDLEFNGREPDLEGLQIRWAHRYNAYNRLAFESADLERLLQSIREQYRRNSTVPSWCGIDLLKGWIFYLVREDHFAGGGTLDQEFQDVLGAISRHPYAEPGDVPPGCRSR